MSYFDSVYMAEDLSHRAKTVYMYLLSMSTSKGSCWPGIRTIAADLSLSRSTVKRAIADLEDAGYIEKTRRYRDNGSCTSNLYVITAPDTDRQGTAMPIIEKPDGTEMPPGKSQDLDFDSTVDPG